MSKDQIQIINDKYPPYSILAQIDMDIFANTKDGTITALYAQPLTEELLSLEYNRATRELIFEFTPGKMPFGMPMNDTIHDIMKNASEITLLQMDSKTGKPALGLKVPLTIL
jgi:hypothetical protein